jgi:hypothetical protein
VVISGEIGLAAWWWICVRFLRKSDGNRCGDIYKRDFVYDGARNRANLEDFCGIGFGLKGTLPVKLLARATR